MGYLYLSAVFLAGCTGLWLAPDTRVFAAQALTDLTPIDLSILGLSPSFLGYRASSRLTPDQFFLVMVIRGISSRCKPSTDGHHLSGELDSRKLAFADGPRQVGPDRC
jgi:hypothetical protein